MKRRTLDFFFAIGGLGLAGLLLIVGIVLSSNANFSDDYVTEQLSAQKITFKTVDKLTDEEKQAACLVEYAGQRLTTGKQAECYANEFIGLHVKNSGGGKTYAELGDVQSGLRTQIADAQKTGAANLADLQKQLADTTSQRETVFKGETLRGILLTSYGFSELGAKAGQGATAVFASAALLFVLSVLGFVHAALTPGSKAVAVPSPGVPDRYEAKTEDMVGI